MFEVYASRYYDQKLEGEYIKQANEKLLDVFFYELKRLKVNQFTLTADELGISELEQGFNIVPNTATEDLAFRRQRLLNRLSTQPPFSMQYLKKKLDEIIGKDAYKTTMDYDNYTLSIESSSKNQNWFEEVIVTINSMKPATIVFVNVPSNTIFMHTTEEVSYAETTFHYKLGVSWKLGEKPFSSDKERGIVKMADVQSIAAGLLNDLAAFTATDIKAVLINDTLRITDFSETTSADNIAHIRYVVMPDVRIAAITDIKLLGENDKLLTNPTVFVPLIEAVTMQHNIKHTEGVF